MNKGQSINKNFNKYQINLTYKKTSMRWERVPDMNWHSTQGGSSNALNHSFHVAENVEILVPVVFIQLMSHLTPVKN